MDCTNDFVNSSNKREWDFAQQNHGLTTASTVLNKLTNQTTTEL